jgi:hypothetical protein
MMNMNFVAFGSVFALTAAAGAITVPFTETFNGAAARWSSSSVFTAINYPASGGPDGSSYGSITTSFANNQSGDQPLLFRGQSNFTSSGNNFVGDWSGSGVTAFSFWMRQNSAATVDVFARFAPAGGPGVAALTSTRIAPNTWTNVVIPIVASNPNFFYEFTDFTVFHNISRVQLGFMLDSSLAGSTTPVTIDVDNVSIVPSPSSLLCVAGAGLIRRRRR